MTDENLDLGHRKRLRERFKKTKGEGFPAYEILELILFLAVPRIDVKPIAKKLLRKFGTLADVLSAPSHLLREIPGIGHQAVHVAHLFHFVSSYILKERFQWNPILTNWAILIDYCKVTMAYETKEMVRALYLNKKGCLIADEIQQTGTIDHTPIYAREIFKRALELQAAGIILVHNHPSEDPCPSKEDIQITENLVILGKELGIEICDHIIIGKEGHISLKALGLF